MFLPEVLVRESSVQVRVHVSDALLHSPRVGDERFDVSSSPLDVGAVLYPQVHERHAGHLVPVCAPENSDPSRLAETRGAAVEGHAWKDGRTRWRVDTDKAADAAVEKFPASLFKRCCVFT